MLISEPRAEPARDVVNGQPGRPSRCEGLWETSVPEEPTRCRVSMLAFDEPPRLWRAASDLFLNGIGACQLCLFGLPHVLIGSEPPGLPELSDEFRHTFGRVIWRPRAKVRICDGATIEMRCGARASRLFTPVAESVFEARWLRAELSSSLATNVATGAVVLLVASETADQQALGARLLLRHGKRDLQTHEFSTQH